MRQTNIQNVDTIAFIYVALKELVHLNSTIDHYETDH